MADETGNDDSTPMLPHEAPPAWTMLGAASRDKADRFLDKQSALTDYQIEQLRQYERYETSHLRWRRFSDQMKGAMQIMVVIVGGLVGAGIGIVMWNASRADGIAVEAFSVPPSFAQAGITGGVMADDITAKIAAIRDQANEISIARSKDVRQEGEDIKVEIPETGVSLSQAWRYLRLWLGHERRLSGNLRTLGDGRIALSVTLDGEGFIAEGPPSALDALEQKAAEHVFAIVDPMNTVLYLTGRGRLAEAVAQAARLHTIFADDPGPPHAASYALWAGMTHQIVGDPVLAVARARIAIALNPKLSAPHMEVMEASGDLGHDEEALAGARIILTSKREDEIASLQAGGFYRIQDRAKFVRDTLTGDFTQAFGEPCAWDCDLGTLLQRRAELTMRLHDPAQARTLIAQALAGGADPKGALRARYFLDLEAQGWQQAAADARAYATWLRDSTPQSPPLTAIQMRTQAQPLLALALARGGDPAGAWRVIADTRGDCYVCVRVRGLVRAAQHQPGAAQFWLARAVRLGPSIPFAYAEWGRMLLDNGDYTAAIAKFSEANAKGPHFADALEDWGEALMAQNRSDLAVAKFAQANKYAPNWRRLHLKWGEALLYAGKSEAAKAQLALAASLAGAPADAAELGYVRAKARF